MKFNFNETKFRELVIYIAKKCELDPTFDAIKLNKILYYSDFAAYRLLRSPITGAEYRKYSEGPAPVCMVQQRRILLDAGDASIEKRQCFTGVLNRLVVADGRKVQLDLFQPEELEIVDEVAAFFHGKTAREVVNYSHQEAGWRLAQPREIIPYETAWISSTPPSQAAEEQALAMYAG